MGQPIAETPPILTREEYRRWAEAQSRGRSERVDGEIVAVAAERAGHARVKAQAWLALTRAIQATGVPCEALPDGIAVEVGDDTDYESDAVVNCDERMADDAIAAPNPVVVVEMLSPSNPSINPGVKLADYFRVPSIRHSLIVRPDRRLVIHHRRRDDGGIETAVVTESRIELDPPGVGIAVADLYAP